jgi:hypothetical protein
VISFVGVTDITSFLKKGNRGRLPGSPGCRQAVMLGAGYSIDGSRATMLRAAGYGLGLASVKVGYGYRLGKGCRGTRVAGSLTRLELWGEGGLGRDVGAELAGLGGTRCG